MALAWEIHGDGIRGSRKVLGVEESTLLQKRKEKVEESTGTGSIHGARVRADGNGTEAKSVATGQIEVPHLTSPTAPVALFF